MILFVANAVAVAVVMAITFFVGERLRRHNVVDVAWGLAFAAVAITSAVLGSGDATRNWLLAVLVTLWGGRLAAYLAIRSRGHGEDPRYEELLAKSRRPRRVAVMTKVYLLQGTLVWLIALPLQVSATQSGAIPAWVVVGIALWAIGFGFEAVGDAQLRAFKRDPANRGRVMDRGLWQYTRHPNYFGDACLWWGLFLIALTAGPIVGLTIISPIIMTTLLVRISGKALLERHMSNRPGFDEYLRRTSGFFPLPPRPSVHAD